MTHAFPQPTNPVRLLSATARRRLACRIDAQSARPARAGVDRVGDCLLAVEAACWAEPCILPQRGVAGGRFVAVVLPGYDGRLTPDEARRAAGRLRADNAFPAALGTALRLEDVADEAERRDSRGGPLNPEPHGSGGKTVVALILIAAAVMALAVFH